MNLLGFDIGGTKCGVVLGHSNGESNISILDKIVVPTDKPVYEMLESLYNIADLLLKKNNATNENLRGIGISCGGPLNSKLGIVLSPPNLPGWDNIPIVEITEKRFGIKTILQNDANACALTEWKYGAGKGFQHLIFLTFGTGMGAGIIINGNLYTGASDLAGEVGHLRLSENGPVGFGKSGSFEGFCSGGGIAQLAQIKVREKLQLGEKVSFCDSLETLNLLTAKSVAEAAYAGDRLAIEIYKTSAAYLGKALSILIDTINPQLIILGSIYGRAQSLIEPTMRSVISKEAIPAAYHACSIVPAALSESIGDFAALALADMSS